MGEELGDAVEGKFPFIPADDLTKVFGPRLGNSLLNMYRGKDKSMKRFVYGIYHKIKNGDFTEGDVYRVEDVFYGRTLSESRFDEEARGNKFSAHCI